MASPPESDTSDVCFFTVSHNTTDSRVVVREAVSLSEAGYDVTYYTPFEGASRVNTESYAEESIDALPGIRDRLVWVATLLYLLYDTEYDVYHFHDVELLPVGVLLGVLTDGDVIYDVHEDVEAVLGHKPIFPRPVRPFLVKIVSAIELTLVRFVDGIVVASPDIAERFADNEEVATVTNYPRRRWAEETDLDHGEPSAAHRQPSVARQQPSADRGQPFVDHGETFTDRGQPSADRRQPIAHESAVRLVYRGLLSEDRGIFTLVDAVERIPEEYDVTLVVGGKYASEAVRSRLQDRADESDRVEIVGWLPTLEDVIDHYRAADVGLMCFHPDPNATNAVHRSNKLFQYMATGLPIVVSDIGNWPDLVADVDCGVAVDPEDPDAIAEAMLRLVDDPELRDRLGRNGHRAALDRFNWETQRDRLLELYERLGIPHREVAPAHQPVQDVETATD